MNDRTPVDTVVLSSEGEESPGDLVMVYVHLNKVNLVVSSRENGDAEVWLQPMECLRLIKALQEAVDRVQ